MRTLTLPALLLLTLGCREKEELPPDLDLDGYSEVDGDCDDSDPAVHPGATELCNGVDDDCDGTVDMEALDALTWYADADADGWGDEAATDEACEAPSGYVDVAEDCDDSDAAFFPGAPEEDCTDPSDYNCDGSVGWADADADGFAACEECDDSDASVNPDATEICDLVDNDCDGVVDEDDASDATTWYADADADGFGDADTSTTACWAPEGYVDNADDCDDTDAAVRPGQHEVCNEVDDDCDGTVDEDDAVGAPTWYADSDADGSGDASTTHVSCDAPSGYVADGSDCDDADASSYPGGEEVCDEADNDCDGSTDEDASDASTWYADLDGDGYGGLLSTTACDQPTGYLSTSTDCDDFDAATYPGADETCDGDDDDCDGDIDEGAIDMDTWYEDADGDGYGDLASTTTACDQPSGYVANDDDCEDSSATASPIGVEICDRLDNDCDGDTDESSAVDALTWYADDDGDDYGDAADTTEACDQPSGYTSDDTDCDDTDAAISPAGTETCDEVDQDCDGDVDEDATDASTWYVDYDRDGYGDAGSSTEACDQPTGYVADGTDCDDLDDDTWPGADETCDGDDDDCDGDTDEGAIDMDTWYADDDGDGYGDAADTTEACEEPSGYTDNDDDCDDTSAQASPLGVEQCDGLDNDCDGDTDEDDAVDADTWYLDFDGDGFGDSSDTLDACDQPSGYVDNEDDCDDTDDTVNPDEADVCDGLDNDCSGTADDDDDYFGTGEDCPGLSCDDILTTSTATLTDDVYWIDPDGSGAYQAWCDMSTTGGGWTLVWKMHHVSSHSNAGPESTTHVDCDMDPLDSANQTDECNIPYKWTNFAPSEIRLVSVNFDFTSNPIDYDWSYSNPSSALDTSNNMLPYTSASHFTAITENCGYGSTIPPTTDTVSSGYWVDKASPGSYGNWDIQLSTGLFDANCHRVYDGYGGWDDATSFIYVR